MTQKNDLARLDAQLQRLHLHDIRDHYLTLATKAAEQQVSHLDYLAQLIEGEAAVRNFRKLVNDLGRWLDRRDARLWRSSGSGRGRSNKQKKGGTG